jgi:hypothetical protein
LFSATPFVKFTFIVSRRDDIVFSGFAAPPGEDDMLGNGVLQSVAEFKFERKWVAEKGDVEEGGRSRRASQ